MDQGTTFRLIYIKDLCDNTTALGEFSKCLDPQFKILKNWEHFAFTLGVPPYVIRTCKLYLEHSPTIKVFEYLAITRPDMTINELLDVLTRNQQRARPDIKAMLEVFKSGDKVSVVITNSTDGACILDQIALKLDSASRPTCNWMDFGLELGIVREKLHQFEMYNYNPTEALFRFLYATSKKTVKASVIVGYLKEMQREDVLTEIRNATQPTDLDITNAKDILKLGSDLLDKTSKMLNKPCQGLEGWRGIARRLMTDQYIDDPDLIRSLEPPILHEIHSPTKKIIEWLAVNKHKTKLADVIGACKKIQRSDAIQVLMERFSRALEFSYFDVQEDSPPSSMRYSIQETSEKGNILISEGRRFGLPESTAECMLRVQERDELVSYLSSGQYQMVVLHSAPGYGKTSLVLYVADELIKNHGCTCIYINSKGVFNLEDFAVKVLSTCGLPAPNTGAKDRVKMLFKSLNRKCVLIVDNVDHLSHANDTAQSNDSTSSTGSISSPGMSSSAGTSIDISTSFPERKRSGLPLFDWSNSQKDEYQNFLIEIIQCVPASAPNVSVLATSWESLTTTKVNAKQKKLLPLPPEKSKELLLHKCKSVLGIEESSISGDLVSEIVKCCSGVPLLLCSAVTFIKSFGSFDEGANKLVGCPLEQLTTKLSLGLEEEANEHKEKAYETYFRKLDLSHLGEPLVPTSTPIEIFLRGQKAIQAYEKALLDGKTKNRRLFVMLIGQSRAGKTSLLKSFRGEKFDSSEDSTECAVLHRYCCKLVDTVWVQDSDIEDKTSFEGVMSKKMAETYQGEEKSHSDMPETSKEASGRDKSLDKNDRPDGIHSSLHTKLDGSAEVDGSTKLDVSTELDGAERSGPNGKLSDSLQNPVDGEDSSSLANRVETKDEVFKRVNNNLRNPKEAGSDDIICSVLDIGGQPVYEVTHPLFISRNGVFLLVHSLKNGAYNKAAPCAEKQNKRRELDDKCCMTNMDHLEFWLSFVELNSAGVFKDASKECELMPNKLPPVFLACTHADKPFHGEVAEEMSRDILKDLKREEHPPGKHLVRSLYVINNTVSGSSEDEGVKKLRKEICDVAKSLPHMNEDIPINWFAFEKELKFLLQKKTRYLSIEEAKEIALNCKVNVDVKSNQFITLLNYLHDIREIIYFEGSQTVFIDIQWLIDMIGKVITVELYENRKEKHDNSWKKLEEEGMLDWSLLKHVWSDELADDEATIDDLIGIMERFSLLYRWKIEGEKNVFLVPAMLSNSNAQNIAELLKDQIPPIIVYFQSSHVPLGIFPRLQVMFAEFCNQKWPRSSQPKFNHNFCRFFKVGEEESFDLVLTSDVKTISVGVVVRKADNLKIMHFCQEILEFLRTKLEVDMRKNFPWMKNMDYQLCIRCPICQPSATCKQPHCPGCTSNACVHFISGEEVLKEEDLSCEKNPVCKNTDIPYEYYFHWFPKSGKPIPSKPVPKDISSRSGAFNMNEENKRWVVVGIAIMKDLLPILRSYIKPEIAKHYNDLKAKHNIDTQITGKHLKKDGSFEFNYESINNNRTKKKSKLYDCKVNSEADLAKLYFKPIMAKFTAIDESCDLSAVLGILSSASVFTPATQDAAKDVRQHVRNDWGHCNFAEWNDVKFQHCFQLMDDLVKTLNLADDEEKKLLEQLKDWKDKGVQLCLGSPIDADLLKVVQNDVAWLIEELQYLKEGDSEQREELKRVTRALDEFRTEVFKRLKKLERGYADHETRITNVQCRVTAVIFLVLFCLFLLCTLLLYSENQGAWPQNWWH